MGGNAVLQAGGDRLRKIDFSHPVRRMFGQSRAVNWGVIFIVIVVGLMLVRPLVMSGMSFQRTHSLLAERRAEVAHLSARNRALDEQVDYYRTDSFVAEQARMYGMIEPGEETYVIRELVHPESAAKYAVARLRNATVDSAATLAAEHGG